MTNPVGQKLCQSQMIPNARRESFATERPPNDPRFKGTKAAAQVDAVIHVVDLRAHRVAEMQVLGHESKEPTQTPDLPDIERTKIKRNKKHFVRINYDRIGFAPACGHPFAFRQKGESSAVCAVDMEPCCVFATYLLYLGNSIRTRC